MSNPRRRNGHRRSRLRRRVLAAYDTCALCGEPVDKTLPAGHPGAAEVDEIIPVSLGGDPLKWSNCRLTHRICNRLRGNKLDDQLPTPRTPTAPTPSREW